MSNSQELFFTRFLAAVELVLGAVVRVVQAPAPVGLAPTLESPANLRLCLYCAILFLTS